MITVSRRTLLLGATATAVAPALPSVAMAGPTPAVPLFPIWEVGVEDYPNWRMIAAKTLERAKQIFREDIGLCKGCDGLRCAEIDTEGDCEHTDLDARKLSGKAFPGKEVEGDIAAGKAEMKAAGWTHECDRCNYDTPDDWTIIGDEAVCRDCLTPLEVDAEDHDDFLNRFINDDYGYSARDPEIFALLRPADLLDESILETLAADAELHPDCLHLMPFRVGAVSSEASVVTEQPETGKGLQPASDAKRTEER